MLKLAWPALPFIDRIGLVFVLCMLLGVLLSHPGGQPHPKAIDYRSVDTRTSAGFNWAALAITLMLAALYISWS
jgi:SSS family solute:Na+ symporter